MSQPTLSKRPSAPVGRPWEGVWSNSGSEHAMGNPAAFQAAADWLKDPQIRVVEDWGCGCGHFKPYVGHWQEWRGVDACGASAATVVDDLRKPREVVDGIHCRGVLEHNDDWELILRNLYHSFRLRAAITIWLPLVPKGKTKREGKEMAVWRYSKEDIIGKRPDDPMFIPTNVTCVHQMTVPRTKIEGCETVFCLERTE